MVQLIQFAASVIQSIQSVHCESIYNEKLTSFGAIGSHADCFHVPIYTTCRATLYFIVMLVGMVPHCM